MHALQIRPELIIGKIRYLLASIYLNNNNKTLIIYFFYRPAEFELLVKRLSMASSLDGAKLVWCD